jgi:hypothetical protein
MSITLEQLIDIIQADLTFSGMLPKVLNDKEVKRVVKEMAMDWFYKHYQFATQKFFYYMKMNKLMYDTYSRFRYFIMPDEVENVTRIVKINDLSMFRLGIQAPNLSINLGVTNQPFLTSFATTAGELAVYRSVISNFADEINKLTKDTVKFSFNHINKQMNFLGSLSGSGEPSNYMLECWVRIQEEELFDFEMFKRYCIGLCKIRMGQQIGQFNFNMPGNFNYNAQDIIAGGQLMVDKVIEEISAQTTVGFFFMSK